MDKIKEAIGTKGSSWIIFSRELNGFKAHGQAGSIEDRAAKRHHPEETEHMEKLLKELKGRPQN
jgi:hypothetical protein